MAEDPDFKRNTNFKRDMFNVAIGVVWQTSLVIFPIYLVLMQVVPTIIAIGVALICSLILKKDMV